MSPIVLEAVLELVPRENRTVERRFLGFGADRFPHRDHAGVPRGRRAGVLAARPPPAADQPLAPGRLPWARIGEHVGQRNLAVTANTYSDVLVDEAELDYAELLATTVAVGTQ